MKYKTSILLLVPLFLCGCDKSDQAVNEVMQSDVMT